MVTSPQGFKYVWNVITTVVQSSDSLRQAEEAWERALQCAVFSWGFTGQRAQLILDHLPK